MHPLLQLAGLALAVAGCSALYLASPHQRWRARPWPALAARSAGAILLLLSAGLFSLGLQRLTLVYTWLTLLMLVFLLLPYLGALRHLLRRPQ